MQEFRGFGLGIWQWPIVNLFLGLVAQKQQVFSKGDSRVYEWSPGEKSYVSPDQTLHNKTVIINLSYDNQDRVTKVEKHVIP